MKKTKIQWTDTTVVVDRGGRRKRVYLRKRTDRPGMRDRRIAAARGEHWCSDCAAWVASAQVSQGRCREHARIAARAHYAKNRAYQCARKVAAKRGRHGVPTIAREVLNDWFGGECAYCDRLATTIDHIVPVSRGGGTSPGQLVPACVYCNSAKRAGDLDTFLQSRPRAKLGLIADVLSLEEESL